MSGWGQEGWGGDERALPRRQASLLAAWLAAGSRALQAESDRWFLWLPMLFAGGIITYFALADEPSLRVAAAFLIAASGIAIFVRHAPLGLCSRRMRCANGAAHASPCVSSSSTI
jgi:competence protein ComEC